MKYSCKKYTISGIAFTFTLFLFIVAKGQSPTNYTNLFNASNFNKTIDLSRPVGFIPGEGNTTPSGGAVYSIPIQLPGGTNNIAPQLVLNYNSQSGNGIAGYGWNISGLSAIGRSSKNNFHNNETSPVKLTNDDVFVLDGARLTAINGNNGEDGTIYGSELETYSVIISNDDYIN
jgi:hypothetical protein